MNTDARRTLYALVRQLNETSATESAEKNLGQRPPLTDARHRAEEALERFFDKHAAGAISRAVDAGTAVEVNNDTAKSLAQSLTALLYAARTAAEDLGRRLPTEGGRDAAKEIERTLGRGSPGDFDGLQVDDAKLECCSGPIADIDESLKPHIARRADEVEEDGMGYDTREEREMDMLP